MKLVTLLHYSQGHMTWKLCSGIYYKCNPLNCVIYVSLSSDLLRPLFVALSWRSALMYLQTVLDEPSPPHLFFLPQVWLIRTPPAQPCPRKARRIPRRPTTSNWEVTSTGQCWCLEGSGCTPTSRSRCSCGRTHTSRTDTEPTCPPGSASRGERHQEMEYFFFLQSNQS